MNLEDLLLWEEGQELRWEYDGFAPVAMTGGTLEHAAIQGNLIATLATRLRGGPCRVLTSDLKLRVDGSIRYPDASVTCSRHQRGTTVIDDPVVVFEILSPGTALTDRVVKNQECCATPSIQRYVMIEQDKVAATVFERAGDDWIGHLLTQEATLAMPEIGVAFPLAELYEGVELPE